MFHFSKFHFATAPTIAGAGPREINNTTARRPSDYFQKKNAHREVSIIRHIAYARGLRKTLETELLSSSSKHSKGARKEHANGRRTIIYVPVSGCSVSAEMITTHRRRKPRLALH
ncbi:hypothetical protein L596_005495 [Steinernema carpocapsae]|uniref:Uncharacterized protein n=1 Tax=Steinernema carpocapsae TaxID=34508 RepID=A0A4U8UZ72_STECR|nr:hypothetical protein L596_005495 [Steinernema carpocapsae]